MSRKQKKSAEEKVKIIRQYQQGEISTEGVSAFLPHKNKAYNPEIKRSAVESYLAGEGSLSEICKRYGIREALNK